MIDLVFCLRCIILCIKYQAIYAFSCFALEFPTTYFWVYKTLNLTRSIEVDDLYLILLPIVQCWLGILTWKTMVAVVVLIMHIFDPISVAENIKPVNTGILILDNISDFVDESVQESKTKENQIVVFMFCTAFITVAVVKFWFGW